MRLFTYREGLAARPGVVLENGLGLDLIGADPSLPPRWNELFAVLERVQELTEYWDGKARESFAAGAEPGDAPRFKLATKQLLPPIAEPSKIIGVGRNYLAHAQEHRAWRPVGVVASRALVLGGQMDDLLSRRHRIVVALHAGVGRPGAGNRHRYGGRSCH